MPTCAQCGSEAVLFVSAPDYNLTKRDIVFNYYRCTNPECGDIFLSPIPDNLGDYYSSDYMIYANPKTIEELVQVFGYQEDVKLKQVQQYVPNGKMMEIGPGYGGFAYRAKRAGFEVEAIEMNADACRFMNDVVGIRAYHTDDPIAALRTSGQYDVIALWHVIEHVPDPWTMLDTLADHLAPGGIVVIAAPNPQAFQFRLFRSYWRPLEAPRHLNLIPAQVIQKRLAAKNIHPLVFNSQDELAKLADYAYWHDAFTRHFSSPILKRLARVASGATHIFARPFEQQPFGRSTYTLIFQRPSAG